MSTLVLIFPGVGYTFDRPLLHFSRKLAERRGMAVYPVPLSVTLDRSLPNKQRMALACEQAVAQARAAVEALDFSGCTQAVLIAKSIGTVAAAAVLEQIPCPARSILYTPLEQTFSYPLGDAVVFTGTDDPWVEPGIIPALCRTRGVPFHLYEGANHSLETGDVLRDIDILRSVMEHTGKLLL